MIDEEEELRNDSMAPEAAMRLATVIDDQRRPVTGDELPLLWHWVYFTELCTPEEIGVDGHPLRRDGLVARYPRRMAGGSKVERLAPFQLGTPASRRSRLAEWKERDGRSGPLAIARYVHTYAQGDRDVRRETQTVIYRGPVAKSEGTPAIAQDTDASIPGERPLFFDPVLLFRFSAVTWNAHRIHYDREYAVGTDGYPGLVVHGPLLALLLMRELEGVIGSIAQVEYRTQSPVFVTDVVHVRLEQESATRWRAEAVHESGRVATSLEAETGVLH